jgi:hypothetical protein
VQFLMKYHMIHSHWRFSLPASHGRRLSPERCVQWLWWENGFDFEELTIHGLAEQERELERFVDVTRPYPAWRVALDWPTRRARSLAGRAIGKLERVFSR